MSDDDSSLIYGLEYQTRALCAQATIDEAKRFLIGTQSLKHTNQIHLIEYDDETNFLTKCIYKHEPGEIWNISAAYERNLFLTCYSSFDPDNSLQMKCTLWSFDDTPEMTIAGDDSTHYSLKKLSDVPIGNITNALWEPTSSSSQIICIADNQFYLIDSKESSPKVVSNASLDSKGQPKFSNLKWNPHHSYTQIATCNDTVIRGWDLRSMKQTYSIESAHGQMVRDLDFNSNKQYYLVSCGDDCKVKFWDIRKTNECLKVLSEHSHWVWSVRYNNFHDQLVLSCSSDTRVILSSVPSLSSEPYGSNSIDDDTSNDNLKDDSQQRIPLEDQIVKIYEEHEDSVYRTEWAASDPWIFASLSYDGRFVINKVPKADKFKIIL